MDKEEKIKKVESEINYLFPEDFKEFLLRLENYHIKPNLFQVDGKEKVIEYLYSFEETDRIYIGKAQKFDSALVDLIVPFAQLAFGDTLCFDRETNHIVLYDHEMDSKKEVADTWYSFYLNLYNENEIKS